MSTVATASNAPTRSSPWFGSAPFDLILILGVPFLTWPLLTAARWTWGADLLTKLILLTATGHYMATFVRAYGDRDLFARFRVRFPGLLGLGWGTGVGLVGLGWLGWAWVSALPE